MKCKLALALLVTGVFALSGNTADAVTVTAASTGIVPTGGANDIDIFYTIGAGVGLVAIATGNPGSNTTMSGAGEPTDTRLTANSGAAKFSSSQVTPAGTMIAWYLVIDPAVTITDWYFTLNGANVNPPPGSYGASTVKYSPPTPVPGALPLFATGLGALGLFRALRRKKEMA